MHEVAVSPLDPDRFRSILSPEQEEAFERLITDGRKALEGRVVWNVNSTAAGGGVAEMLKPLIGYCRGVGVDARWVVIDGDPDFFTLTKRIHNRLHGAFGDGGPLGPEEHAIYERVSERNAAPLVELVAKGDVVLLHDPQTAGLVAPLQKAGARVIWRCHVGLDTPNERTHEAWDFLRGYVEPAEAYIFSREAFVWTDLDVDRIAIIPPSIDAFSPKNQDMSPEAVHAILVVSGIIADGDLRTEAVFTRADGTPGRVDRRARIVGDAMVPEGVPMLTQVSRWDRLKDPVGVMHVFAEYVAPHCDAHLLLVGPDVDAVSDDPEGLEVLAECREHWSGFDEAMRARIHLITLPMNDPEENAAMVNAIQRASTIIVQKSLAEGFGLTVTEGMWKGRPVIASRIGGIQDQITDGVTGILIDAGDHQRGGEAAVALIRDPALADKIGAAAYERVREQYLGARHLGQYLELLTRVGATAGRP